MPESTDKFRQIEELIAMRPFRPFAVETRGGSKYVVQSPDHVKLPPGFSANLKSRASWSTTSLTRSCPSPAIVKSGSINVS
jgi:hypothetical protein